MKKIMFTLALMLTGGVSLSTAAAAHVLPTTDGIAAVAQVGNGMQRVGGWKHWKHWKHKRFGQKYGGYGYGNYRNKFKFYPNHYYKGFCYNKPYHWWCKNYFFRKKYDDDY